MRVRKRDSVCSPPMVMTIVLFTPAIQIDSPYSLLRVRVAVELEVRLRRASVVRGHGSVSGVGDGERRRAALQWHTACRARWAGCVARMDASRAWRGVRTIMPEKLSHSVSLTTFLVERRFSCAADLCSLMCALPAHLRMILPVPVARKRLAADCGRSRTGRSGVSGTRSGVPRCQRRRTARWAPTASAVPTASAAPDELPHWQAPQRAPLASG